MYMLKVYKHLYISLLAAQKLLQKLIYNSVQNWFVGNSFCLSLSESIKPSFYLQRSRYRI